VPCRLPDFDDDRPQVVLANPIVYRNDRLPEDLHATLPYYFDGPEKYVSEKVVPGFGPFGYSPRIEGPTTAEFVTGSGSHEEEIAAAVPIIQPLIEEVVVDGDTCASCQSPRRPSARRRYDRGKPGSSGARGRSRLSSRTTSGPAASGASRSPWTSWRRQGLADALWLGR